MLQPIVLFCYDLKEVVGFLIQSSYYYIVLLYQDLQYANQKAQALEAELLQKLEAEQTPNVQKVINELVKAKKISLLLWALELTVKCVLFAN